MSAEVKRLVFAGTPEFAARPLEALIAAGLSPVAVYTQPDRPAGRGRKLAPSPVKQVAEAAGIAVHQPASLRDPEAQAAFKALAPDLFIVIAYGLILPQAVLDIPPLGCVNLHASLLPRWRGAAPIQRAIEAGDADTGLCLMQMDAGLDTGPVLARVHCPIAARMTGGELHDELAALGALNLPGWIEALLAGRLQPQVQDEREACYAHKLSKAEAMLDFRLPAEQLDRRIRAFNPWPVASAMLNGEVLRIWSTAGLAPTLDAAPGTISAVDARGLRVACGQDSLIISELQFPGGRRLPAAAVAQGRDLIGQVFEHVG